MVPSVNCKVFCLLLVLVIITPVSADISNTSLQFSEDGSEKTPVPFSIVLFIPTSTMVHSTQVMDQVSGPDNTTVLATSFGLSTYRGGAWTTRHTNLVNISEGLMDDYITAVEYDRDGNLWIGTPRGIQIYNGRYYENFYDPLLLRDTRIADLQRWNDDMWVATGFFGIHRYRDGQWTWYDPGSDGGPGFYETDSMAVDHAANATLIATDREGLWIIRSQDDPIRFECIAGKDSSFGLLDHVRRDQWGGVFFFNDSTVMHYSTVTNFTPVLTSRSLSISSPRINDLAAAPDGKLYLATDQGIYVWKDGSTLLYLDRFKGIGTSSVVNTIFIDSTKRVWFSTQDNVGYYIDLTGSSGPVPVQMVTSTQPETTGALPGPVPTFREETVTTVTTVITESVNTGGPFAGIDPIIRAIRSFFTGIGLKPRF